LSTNTSQPEAAMKNLLALPAIGDDTRESERKFWERSAWFDRESRSTAAIMQTARTRIMRSIVMRVFAVAWAALLLQAQDATYPSPKASPPKIEPQIVLLAESVVQTQWTHTLNLVNAPQNITLLNPGQCIRVGIHSTGDKRDDYLEKTVVLPRTICRS
jgi:hypothetical protein